MGGTVGGRGGLRRAAAGPLPVAPAAAARTSRAATAHETSRPGDPATRDWTTRPIVTAIVTIDVTMAGQRIGVWVALRPRLWVFAHVRML
jgi:hypothetical protein